MADTVVPIIADVVESLSGWITSMQETGTTSGVFDTIRNAIAAVPGILEQLSQGLATVGTFLQPLTDAFMNWVGVVVPAIVSAGTAIAEYLGSPAVQGYLATLQTAFTALATLIMDVVVLAFNLSAIAWQYLSDAFTIAWPYIKTVLDTFYSLATIVMGAVTGILTALSQVVKGDFSGAFETMKTTVGTALEDLWEFFKTLDKNLLTFFDTIKPEALKLGTSLMQGIADGITSGATLLKDAAMTAAKEAYQAIKDFFGISSPSKLMHDMVGINVSKGIAGGIKDGIPEVIGASEQAAMSAAQTVNNFTFSASYANTQSESSLINDARAWMMTLGEA
jgi:phage-related protein